MSERLLTFNEALGRLRISRSSAYKLIHEKKLKTVLICGRRLVPETAIEELIRESAS